MGTIAARAVQSAGCECGRLLIGKDGAAVPNLATWSHLMFFCDAPDYKVRREDVWRALEGVSLGDAFNGAGRGGTKWQLSQLMSLLEGDQSAQVDFDMSNEQARELERKMRRVFGACITGTGDRCTDRSSAVCGNSCVG